MKRLNHHSSVTPVPSIISPVLTEHAVAQEDERCNSVNFIAMSGLFSCNVCKTQFSCIGNLNKHKKNILCSEKTKNEQFEHRCPLCDYSSKYLSNLHSHGEHKHGEQLRIFKQSLSRQAEIRKCQKNQTDGIATHRPVRRQPNRMRPHKNQSKHEKTRARSVSVVSNPPHIGSASSGMNGKGFLEQENIAASSHAHVFTSFVSGDDDSCSPPPYTKIDTN